MTALPETSHLANEQMTKELREQHHAKILKSIEALGEAIYEVIAWHCGIEKHQVGRRLKELVDAGKIYNTLRTGITGTGRKANMYAIRKADTVLPEPEPKHHPEIVPSDFASLLVNRKENLKQQVSVQFDLFGNKK